MLSNISMYQVSVWIIPVLLAITFHEAAHAFVARHFGDRTASRLGRVSLNPIRHIDPIGTILFPAILVLSHSPFLFGYAKPVPVNFGALRNPRMDMVWVAAAGPAMNILLAIIAALGLHLVGFLPSGGDQWMFDNLKNSLIINVMLAIFNLFPLPPLDGGKIAVGLLPDVLAVPLARLENYGMLVLIGLLILLPMLGNQLGLQLNPISSILTAFTNFVIGWVLFLTGNGSI